MHVLGHVGAALFLYAPVAAALNWLGEPILAAFGLVMAAALSTLPDVDGSLPIPHRGPTHTVWFVVACTVVAGTLGWLLGSPGGNGVLLAATFGTATALSLTSHLLADVITPMGIRPFAPFLRCHHSFDLVYSKNRRANRVVLSLGLVAATVSQLVFLL